MKIPSHFFSFFFLLTFVGTTAAQNFSLSSYYAAANGKKGAALKTSLCGIINGHTDLGYDGLHEAYKTSDLRPDGKLRDWYSNITNFTPVKDKAGTYKKEGDCYNREHSVPQSWFSKASPMRSDLVHVIPTDGYVNNRRSNFPFGENKGEIYKSANAYSKLGACTVSGYSGTCFEPNDEIKGDMARIYFYMVTCYEKRISSWDGGTASQVFDGKTYPGLKPWTLQMMLRWAKQDPVDERERARNEAVYKLQKNRNPFVDYPSLCEYVWGDSVNYAFNVNGSHGYGPDPTDPDVDPEPTEEEPTDTIVNPAAQSGLIDLTKLDWKVANHPTYGNGFTATTPTGLTVSYYTFNSQNPVIQSEDGVRLYKNAVLLVEGAVIIRVVFHAADSKLADLSIQDKTYMWKNATVTWEGSMNPFMVTASGGQSRISRLEVTVLTPELPTALPSLPVGLSLRGQAVYDAHGRYMGTEVPSRRGVYVVRRNSRTGKHIVN